MHCREFYEYAERWMEGESPAGAAAHLEACPHCRGLIGELRTIQAAARELEAEAEPPALAWTALRAQLESEGLIAKQAGAGWIAGFFRGLYRPALAGAYLSVLLAAALLLSLPSGRPYQEMAQVDLAPPEIASLQAQLAGAGHVVASLPHRNSQVTASYRENLRIVDKVISECEKRMQQEPQDEIAREYLYGAYRQKAELLNSMWEREATGQ
jgi:hypothetical protein